MITGRMLFEACGKQGVISDLRGWDFLSVEEKARWNAAADHLNRSAKLRRQR